MPTARYRDLSEHAKQAGNERDSSADPLYQVLVHFLQQLGEGFDVGVIRRQLLIYTPTPSRRYFQLNKYGAVRPSVTQYKIDYI